jgi:hypothetical protein
MPSTKTGRIEVIFGPMFSGKIKQNSRGNRENSLKKNEHCSLPTTLHFFFFFTHFMWKNFFISLLYQAPLMAYFNYQVKLQNFSVVFVVIPLQNKNVW